MRSQRRSAALAVFVLLAAAMWLVALPRLAATESMRRRIEAAERAGIDPAAVFWTEHAALGRPR